MGKAAGVDDPYNMTDEELARSRSWLDQLKPNILRLAQQNTDTVAALTSGEAWLVTGNLGTDERVKDGGGPEIKVFTPKEGTIGWMDAEMIVKGGANTTLILPWLELAQRPRTSPRTSSATAGRCSTRRPTRCSSTRGSRSGRTGSCTTSPRRSLAMTTLKGPGSSTQAAIERSTRCSEREPRRSMATGSPAGRGCPADRPSATARAVDHPACAGAAGRCWCWACCSWARWRSWSCSASCAPTPSFDLVPDWNLDNYLKFFTMPTYVRTFGKTLVMAAR